jgi:hypothetical protein
MEIYLEKCLCMVHFVLLFIWVKANKLLIPTLHLQWVFMEGLVQHILNFWKYKTCSRLCKNFHKFTCWIVYVHVCVCTSTCNERIDLEVEANTTIVLHGSWSMEITKHVITITQQGKCCLAFWKDQQLFF